MNRLFKKELILNKTKFFLPVRPKLGEREPCRMPPVPLLLLLPLLLLRLFRTFGLDDWRVPGSYLRLSFLLPSTAAFHSRRDIWSHDTLSYHSCSF